MTPNSAYELVEIVKDTDYAPRMTHMSETSVVSKGLTPPIFALWCVSSCQEGFIEILPLGNENPISIPCNAIKPGVVYYIYLKKLLSDNMGQVKFIGYRYKDAPIQY